MEVVPYFLSVIAVAVAFYWSAREYRRKPGTPTTGLFRYHEVLPAIAARAKAETGNILSVNARLARQSSGVSAKPMPPGR